MPVFNSAVFHKDVYFTDVGEGAVKTGTGGIDPPGKRRRKLHLPFKPTGLLDRPVKTALDARVEETRQIHEEVSGRMEREFIAPQPEMQSAPAPEVSLMTEQEIEAEIGLLLRKKMRNEEDEIMLLILMVASA